MEYKKISQYQSLIAAIIILFLFFVPTPTILTAILLWIVIFIVSNQLTNNILISLFISTSFMALFFIFNGIGKRKVNYVPVNQFNDLFLENFEGGDDEGVDNENKLLVENPKKETEEINVEMQFDDEKEKPVKKISMMDNQKDDDEEDPFGKLDTGVFEDSDDDSDEDEVNEDDVGKSKNSTKKAYKAQKQLYDLTSATKKLQETMENLSAPLKKGQKIIESLEKFGISKFV